MPNRKSIIRNAISGGPRYGGPKGGRPNTKRSVTATTRGINYLVGGKGSQNATPRRKSGSLNIAPKVKRQIRKYY